MEKIINNVFEESKETVISEVEHLSNSVFNSYKIFENFLKGEIFENNEGYFDDLLRIISLKNMSLYKLDFSELFNDLKNSIKNNLFEVIKETLPNFENFEFDGLDIEIKEDILDFDLDSLANKFENYNEFKKYLSKIEREYYTLREQIFIKVIRKIYLGNDIPNMVCEDMEICLKFIVKWFWDNDSVVFKDNLTEDYKKLFDIKMVIKNMLNEIETNLMGLLYKFDNIDKNILEKNVVGLEYIKDYKLVIINASCKGKIFYNYEDIGNLIFEKEHKINSLKGDRNNLKIHLLDKNNYGNVDDVYYQVLRGGQSNNNEIYQLVDTIKILENEKYNIIKVKDLKVSSNRKIKIKLMIKKEIPINVCSIADNRKAMNEKTVIDEFKEYFLKNVYKKNDNLLNNIILDKLNKYDYDSTEFVEGYEDRNNKKHNHKRIIKFVIKFDDMVSFWKNNDKFYLSYKDNKIYYKEIENFSKNEKLEEFFSFISDTNNFFINYINDFEQVTNKINILTDSLFQQYMIFLYLNRQAIFDFVDANRGYYKSFDDFANIEGLDKLDFEIVKGVE